MPKLQIIQPDSPVLRLTHQDFINGAEPGMIHDGVKAFDSALVVVALFRVKIQQWNGGLVKDFGTEDSPAAAKILKRTAKIHGCHRLWDGSRIVRVAQYVGYRIDEAGERELVQLEFSGSEFDVARMWNSVFMEQKVMVEQKEVCAPMFWCTYCLRTSVKAENVNDTSEWFGWDIYREGLTKDLPNGPDIYFAARALKKSILDGSFEFMGELGTTTEASATAEQ